jgi:NAD(P)-dependent dehydrogenase (short-subunit alcohol dehydrogenase family)
VDFVQESAVETHCIKLDSAQKASGFVICQFLVCLPLSLVISSAEKSMDAASSARTQAVAALIPALMDPIDIANLALFLASDESRYINGAIMPADAGWKAV